MIQNMEQIELESRGKTKKRKRIDPADVADMDPNPIRNPSYSLQAA